MHKVRKGLGILIALTLVTTSLLTGCGSKKVNGDTASTQETNQVATTTNAATTIVKEELKPVDLTWYAIGSPQKDQQMVIDEMNKTLKEKLNVTLKMNVLDWGAYNDKMKVIMAGGEPFDICFTASWTNNYNGAVAKGAYLELDELIQKYGKSILEQMPKDYWNAMKVNGKIYGIFNYQIACMNNGFVADKALVEKYAFDYKSVKKLQDLEPFVKNVVEGENGKITASTNIITGDLQPFNFETGIKYFPASGSAHIPLWVKADDKDLKVLNLYETTDMMDLLKITRSWYLKDYIKKDLASIKDMSNDRKSGKFCIDLGGNLKPGVEAEYFSNYKHEVVSIPMYPAFARTEDITATLLAISKNSPNPERAMMLIDLLWSDKELYNTLCFGIEGKHYTKIDDVTVETLKDSAYNPGSDWQFGNQFNAFLRKGQSKDTWEVTKKLNDEAVKSNLLGFVFDRETVKNESAAIEGILQEYSYPLYVGAIDPEKHVPIMNKKLKDAGIDKVAAELQTQIDTWKAANNK